ncbi:MAG: glycosyltransferase family 2 protein [Acidobacteria bacterium]|nr:glycosyltransferase family 2 protein [Acidobacteriota bacterium]
MLLPSVSDLLFDARLLLREALLLAESLIGAVSGWLDPASRSASQGSSLEWTMVALYLAAMLVLSVYGLHRYQLVYLYYRNRHRAAGEAAERFERLPAITVQLPIYNEQFVVEQLLEAVCRLEYPRELLQIQVLDDSTDETQALARAASERYAALGHPVEYVHRTHRDGFKAGALQAGLDTASGELIAVFDADFQPLPDFLHRTVHHFSDPQVGVVQARWTFLNRDQSVLTRVQAMLLDGHFIFEHGGRARSGRFFNFNGTAGLLRRSMIEDAGGWQHDTLTEDTDLSYRAQLKGWKFVYAQHVEVPSELPADLTAFQIQQARWAKGLIQTARKILPLIFASPLPVKIKLEAFFHLTANLTYPLVVVLSILLLPATIVRFHYGGAGFLLIDIVLFLGTFSSLSTFYLLAQKELSAVGWRRGMVLIPALVATGIGLTITNTRAVLEGLLGVPSPFERTAKYTTDRGLARLARLRYRPPSGLLPLANFAAGSYFACCGVYLAGVGNWATLPFVALFGAGFYLTGGMLLLQACEFRWNGGRAARLGSGEDPAA